MRVKYGIAPKLWEFVSIEYSIIECEERIRECREEDRDYWETQLLMLHLYRIGVRKIQAIEEFGDTGVSTNA